MTEINFAAQKPKSSFNINHVAFILGCAAVLGVLAYLQAPNAKLMSQANMPVDQSLAISLAQTANAADASAQNNQAYSAVLGAQTYNPDLSNQFNNIKVKTIPDNSAAAVARYTGQFSIVLQDDNFQNIADETGPRDGVTPHQKKFLNDLQAIAVPANLADYHRLVLAEYTLIFMQNGGSSISGIQELTSAVQDQINTIKSSVKNSVGIDLP